MFSLDSIHKYIAKECAQSKLVGNTITAKQAFLNIMKKDKKFASYIRKWRKKRHYASNYFRKDVQAVGETFYHTGIT